MKRVLFALTASTAIAGCANFEPPAQFAPAAVVETADVMLDDGARMIAWSTAPESAPATVRASSDPAASPQDGALVSKDDTDGDARFDSALDHRVYFTISTASGDYERAALRLLPLEGGRNFRDLGGYKTHDGKSVKWGRLFRSGRLSALTDADYAFLRELDIETVVDFRSNGERIEEKTDWRAGAPEFLEKDYEAGGDNEAFARALMAPDATPESVAAVMTAFYREVPYEFADQYARLFDRLANRDAPLLFHCSAGKDRTGVAAALILTALGVPRETVLADYALSEKLVDYLAEYDEAAGGDEDGAYAFMRQLPRELLSPLMRSDPRYLEAALTRIEEDHGSVLAYIETELGVDPAALSTIRDRLLETTGN